MKSTPRPSELPFEEIDSRVRWSPEIESQPLSTHIEAWIESLSQCSGLERPILQPPANESELRDAEQRLGIALPTQLSEFYSFTNGIEWPSKPGEPVGPMRGRFPPILQLSVAGALQPPLSERLASHARKHRWWKRPQKVAIRYPSVLAVFNEPEVELQFSDLDPFLALQLPTTSSTCLLMAQTSELCVPIGTVIQIENFHAFRYTSLAHWFNAKAALYRPFTRSPKR